MAKPATAFICQECGGAHAKWAGKCPACGAWNTLVEETAEPRLAGGLGSGGTVIALQPLEGDTDEAPRRRIGLGELDRVLGGGLVPGSAILVGGDPGIGKSTLLLQAAVARRVRRLFLRRGSHCPGAVARSAARRAIGAGRTRR
jgi:DNA repair protein RadA/Sms